MMVTRDERLVALASRWFDLDDLLAIRKRMIGTGLIGGKSVGMLLARAILCKADPRWRDRLETHDSFYIGSDVFYTFLVRNGCWWVRRGQRNADTFLDGAEEARERILSGTFPGFLQEQFVAMLDYFGQSPIIVRSSSLLEDSFGNAFAGKYDSVFCPNQGSPQERLEAFLVGGPDRLRQHDEPGGAPVPRAPGADRPGRADGDPGPARLGRRPRAPVLPAGGGGRAVVQPVRLERADRPRGRRAAPGLRAGDAGGRPVRRRLHPPGGAERAAAPPRRGTIRRRAAFSQRRVDVLDLRANRFASERIDDVARASPDLPIDLYAVRRSALLRGRGRRLPGRPTKGGSSRSGNSCRRRRSSRTCARCWGSSGTPTTTRWTPSSRRTSFRTGGASSTSCNAGRCR